MRDGTAPTSVSPLLVLAAFASDRRVVLATLAILIIAHGVLLVIGQAP